MKNDDKCIYISAAGFIQYCIIIIVTAVLGVGPFSTYPQSAHAASACKANSANQDCADFFLSQSNRSPIVGSREFVAWFSLPIKSPPYRGVAWTSLYFHSSWLGRRKQTSFWNYQFCILTLSFPSTRLCNYLYFLIYHVSCDVGLHQLLPFFQNLVLHFVSGFNFRLFFIIKFSSDNYVRHVQHNFVSVFFPNSGKIN